jgi:hypothetical protein
MASSSTTNPAYSVLAFNGRDRLVRIHQEITDLLHYQSHVHLAAASHLLPGTRTANQQEREAIIEFLKEERARIQDPPRPPRHGREQRCGAPRALRRLAHHRRRRLGDIRMGTHAAMGRTAASGRPSRRRTTSMTTSWPVDRQVHHTVSAATPTTPALKNPTTTTTRPPR